MKTFYLLLIFTILGLGLQAQNFTTNTTPQGLEHNVLFNATDRFTVTQEGSALFSLHRLFDGRMSPSYTASEVAPSTPTVITIEGLPQSHTQRGAWVGWSTRYWAPRRFKIEGYNTYQSSSGSYTLGWVTLADYENQDYNQREFTKKVKAGRYTKLRITIWASQYDKNRLGLSEIYFIHPEAVYPYQGLLSSQQNQWDRHGSDLYFDEGAIAIGTSKHDEGALMTVAGTINAREIKVTQQAGADFVFDEDYELLPPEALARFILQNKHLPEVPSAKEMERDGVKQSEMNQLLLQKIEELTLYMLKQERALDSLRTRCEELEKQL